MMRRSQTPAARAEAEALALMALAFLAEDRARLMRFLDMTGIDPATLREHAGSPDLLAAVLDHLLSDESALLVFSTTASISPDSVAPAREVLRNAEKG